MDLYEKSLRTLELPKVLELLAQHASSEHARELCRALRPQQSLNRCELLQQQCADAVYLMGLQGSPGFEGLKDVSESTARAERGGSLSPPELLRVAQLLRTARLTRAYIEERKGEQTSIDELFHALSGNKYLEEKITQAIISEDEIADHASPELYDIRRAMRAASSKVRDVLNKIISSSANQKMLQDSLITIRSGRYVVPVKSEYKGSFGGLVHDVSSSGATLFVEPTAVVELNNSLRVLQGKEQHEIERILAALSAEVASFSGSIAHDYEVLCSLDFIFARGKLAYKMKALRPKLNRDGITLLRRARHPLLDPDRAVPITFQIGSHSDTVVITGPNTGGKTVSIKTLGLLTVMAQCGLQIPAGDDSTVAVYDHVLADIGDEQSIEQSLSTFSSHMRNITEILEQADGHTLVLLDELGAGTDPVEGAALAVAIIEELRARGSTVAATTHYAELKIYALQTEGVENASCEFDVETLMPTYKLVFGVPGRSNAFAISQRLGLSTHIIEQAQKRLDSDNQRFEEVITTLEEKRQAMEKRLADAERDSRAAAERARIARERLETLEGEREKLVLEAKLKAQEIINNARAAADYAFNEAKRMKKEAEEGKDPNLAAARAALRGKLSDAERENTMQRAERRAMPLPRALTAGDTVEIAATKTRATVIETPKKDEPVRVQAGILKMVVPQNELTLLEDPPPEKEKAAPKQVKSVPKGRPEGAASLDLRGMNADEAILEVDRFIDNAIRLRLPSVTIIHGKGTGVLRSAVQAHLRTLRQVRAFRLGVYGEGEAGVTIATLE